MKTVRLSIKDATYQELSKALLELGFENQSDETRFRYVHPKSGTKVLLNAAPETDWVDKAHFAGTAIILKGKGILKNREALGQIIEKIRLVQESVPSMA